MSEARADDSRRNRKASTGPKTAAGKARSSKNALRHGFTAAVREEGEEVAAQISRLASAFLGEMPATEAALALARDAARAQRALDLIRLGRLHLMAATEEDASTYAGPPRRTDGRVMMATLNLASSGAADIGGAALREMLARLRREAPRDPLRRHAEVFAKIAADLERLDRYERSASGRRRQATFALDALRAGVVDERASRQKW
jgi:hypothetical protein